MAELALNIGWHHAASSAHAVETIPRTTGGGRRGRSGWRYRRCRGTGAGLSGEFAHFWSGDQGQGNACADRELGLACDRAASAGGSPETSPECVLAGVASRESSIQPSRQIPGTYVPHRREVW